MLGLYPFLRPRGALLRKTADAKASVSHALPAQRGANGGHLSAAVAFPSLRATRCLGATPSKSIPLLSHTT
eukprot:2398527-Amphidinium_carterae.1